LIFERLSIPELVIFIPRVIDDDRGFFFESFNHHVFTNETGVDLHFVQDNHSLSHHEVLRGLHYQLRPKAQGKLIRVVYGRVFDAVVDIRRSSPTFGRWVGVELSSDNKKQLWVPPGFAHGFLTLSKEAEVLYKVTDYYAPEYERHIIWNDPDIGIKWPINYQPVLSEKDQIEHLMNNVNIFD
jgi:dTDP-4-dehydrorhamnose 3,5-epimerase